MAGRLGSHPVARVYRARSAGAVAGVGRRPAAARSWWCAGSLARWVSDAISPRSPPPTARCTRVPSRRSRSQATEAYRARQRIMGSRWHNVPPGGTRGPARRPSRRPSPPMPCGSPPAGLV